MNPLIKTGIIAFLCAVAAYFLLIKPMRAEATTVTIWAVDPLVAEPFQRADGAWGHRMTLQHVVTATSSEECEIAKDDIVAQLRSDEAATAAAIGWPGEYTPISSARCIGLSKDIVMVPVSTFLEPIVCDAHFVWTQGFDYLAALEECTAP